MILDGKKIVFLGDSITHGDCISDRSNSYVERVKRAFKWGEVANYSVPGSRIAEYIGPDPRAIKGSFVERYSEMPDDMDIVVVFGGTNDFGIGNAPMGDISDDTPETFCGAVNLLMKGLKEKYPESFVVFMTPLHRKTENIANEFSGAVLDEYVKVLCDKAEENGFHVFDLRSAASLQPCDEYYEKLIREDGIHPNDRGHELIAKELIQYLETI